MSVVFTRISDLEKYLSTRINVVLDLDVADLIKDRLIENAADVVYSVYSPSVYDHPIGDRRYSLLESENYRVDKNKNMGITVTPVARFNPLVWRYEEKEDGTLEWFSLPSQNSGDELAGLINYGDGWHGYKYDFTEDEDGEYEEDVRSYSAPRPFIDITKQELEDGLLYVTLGEGLEKLGLDVIYK